MTTILLIVQFVLAIILTIAILLQKSSSIGLGAYSGSNESLFGAKGPAGFLAKFTFFVGILFILNTLFLGYTYNSETKDSLADQIVKSDKKEKKQEVPTAPQTQIPSKSDTKAPQAPIMPDVNKTN